MTSKLTLYNGALRKLGHDKLASLAEEAERRYVLDDVYDDTLELCLESGQWKFANRVAEVASAIGVTPEFGFTYAFEKPSDFVRLTAISGNENLRPSLSDYREEGGYWLADVDPIYIGYVSNDTDYGMDMTLWPPSFIEFVEYSLAEAICIRLTQSDAKHEKIKKDLKDARKNCRGLDAQAGPNRYMDTAGSWLRNRFSGSTNTTRYDRGGWG